MQSPDNPEEVMQSRTLVQRATLGLAVAMLSLAIAPAAMAAKLVNRNLTQLIADSETIIAGTVTAVTDGINENGVPYTEVTIAVASAAKGAVKGAVKGATKRGAAGDASEAPVYTFRQFGLLKPRVMDNGRTFLGVTPEGFARWHEGETVIAFLHKPASMTGLQTTAGLAHGKLVLRNGLYANEFNNRGLFDGVEINRGLTTPAQQNMLLNPGPADAGALMELIERAVADNWIERGEMR
jgi:hypothetical protein